MLLLLQVVDYEQSLHMEPLLFMYLLVSFLFNMYLTLFKAQGKKQMLYIATFVAAVLHGDGVDDLRAKMMCSKWM